MKMQVETFVVILLGALLVSPAFGQADRFQGEQIAADAVREMERARLERRAGDHESAIAKLSTLVEQEPNYYLAWYNLGLAQAQASQYEAAATSLLRALELKEELGIPDDTIYNSVGWAHYLRGDYRAAKPLLEKAASQEGISERSRTRALNNLGTVLLRLQEYEEAEEALEKANEYGSSRAETNLRVLDAARSVTIRQQRLETKKSEGGD